MSRRVPALAMLVALVALRTAAQDSTAVVVDSTSRSTPSGPDTASILPVDSSSRSVGDTLHARPRLLVFPIVDSSGNDSSMVFSLFRDLLVKEITKDTIDHGIVEGWVNSSVATFAEAESLGRGKAQTILWLELVRRDSGQKILQARLCGLAPDSVLSQGEFLFPDSADQVLSALPPAVLLALFPRTIPTPPKPVSLTDSVKPVAVFVFFPEGTATQAHANVFTDSLIARLQGQDGFRVLPRKLRDSLLAGWDPGECFTTSCRREVGERLGIPWFVAGRLVQLGDKWSVRADLVRTDSAANARTAVVQCQGAPAPSLKLAAGMTARQLAGLEKPRKELSDAPVAREPSGPVWGRLLALGVATTLGLVGVILSW